MGLEKWDREALSGLFAEAVEQLREALPGPAPAAALRRIRLLEDLSAALGRNVGPGHVAGWLCAAAFTP